MKSGRTDVCIRRRCQSDRVFGARTQALTPEDRLDTSKEDAENEENFKIADAPHQEALERGDNDAIELERLSQEARQEVANTKRQTRRTGKR